MSTTCIRLCATAFLIMAGPCATRAQVSPYCTATNTNFDFGTLTINSLVGANTTATVTSTCVPGYPVQSTTNLFCYSIGSGASGNRSLKSGAYSIRYEIYNDAAATTACEPEGVFSTPSCYTTGPFPVTKPESATKTLYARIVSYSTNLPPGTYTDSYTGAQATVNNWGAGSFHCGGHYAETPFTLTLALAPSCSMTANNLVFPGAGFDTAIDASTTLSVTCTNTTPYSVSLSNGNGVGATFATRKMTSSSGKTVNYNLYRNAARTSIWADGFFKSSGTGTGSPQSFTVYGRVPAQTAPPPGTYQDQVIVTVNY
jgi:spore coat protein U-like protein